MEANYDWVENEINKQIYTCYIYKILDKSTKKKHVQMFFTYVSFVFLSRNLFIYLNNVLQKKTNDKKKKTLFFSNNSMFYYHLTKVFQRTEGKITPSTGV